MRIWDVDEGSAAYVRANNRRNVVIDAGAGTKNTEFSPLQWLNCPEFGIPSLDYLIISHPHHDHIEDLRTIQELGMEPTILTRPASAAKLVEENISSARKEGSIDYIKDAEYYLDLDERYNQTPSIPPDHPDWANGVTFNNYSTRSPYLGSDNYHRINNLSIVTVIECFGFKLVMMGDLMPRGIETLFEPGNEAWEAVSDADVLIAPHHGRKSSFDRNLVNHINPDLVVFSDKDDQGHNATSDYSIHANGEFVLDEDNDCRKSRNVLTTRNDGRIRIRANNSERWEASYKSHYAMNSADDRRYSQPRR